MTRLRIVTFALIATFLIGCHAAPAPVPDPDPNQPEIIEIIAPAQIAQETLDSLNLGEPNSEMSERNKRTIGILRQLFPTLSQIVDRKIQQIFSLVFRTVGRNLLAGALGGGGGNAGGTSSNDGGRISVSLPAFGPDDDDDDDDSDEDTSSNTSSSSSKPESRFGSDDQTSSSTDSNNEVQTSNGENQTSSNPSVETPQPPASYLTLSSSDDEQSSTSPDNLFLPPHVTLSDTNNTSTISATAAVNADENLLSEAESQQSEVRVQFADPDGEKKAEETNDDQVSAASGGNNEAIDDLSLDDTDINDENRNKRFLSFGGSSGDSSGHSGSGGGSGNFLFDIIRRPAESVARAAGQAFRILTGTDSIGLGITATHTAIRDLPVANNATKLVAGSGGTEASDEATSSAHDGDVGKGDGYTEGIPGPVTRLFIIANRGISNLIQELILRIAQTSERLVNFKARLITSII